MGLAVEMFNAVRMEDAERQPWVWVILLWILFQMCFSLHPLELSKQKLASSLEFWLSAFPSAGLLFPSYHAGIYCVVDGQPVDGIQMLD